MKPAKAAPESPRLIRPLVDFLRTESAGGVVLVAATVVALLWANSPWKAGYAELWSTDLAISLGDHTVSLTLRGWINEGLMTLFFFVVGLEIKRELVEGELRDPRRAALPAIAAVGGMVVPALIYLAITVGTEAAGRLGHSHRDRHRDRPRCPRSPGRTGLAVVEAVPARARDRR